MIPWWGWLIIGVVAWSILLFSGVFVLTWRSQRQQVKEMAEMQKHLTGPYGALPDAFGPRSQRRP